MHQVLQNLRNGATETLQVPTPQCPPGHVLIASRRSLISPGTERVLVEFGRAGMLAKARSQPDKVRQVIEKIKVDGLGSTYKAVETKLDQLLPLGYCNFGVVIQKCPTVTDLEVGDRVASNGRHAEVVCVPRNLVVRVPDCVDDDSAAFIVPGAIALQSVRLLTPTLGERVVVSGLGLIGLLTVQLLVANGCAVLGLDYEPSRLGLARQFGADVVQLGAGEDPLVAAATFSRGRGVDGVIIAAATHSHELVHQAATMCRKRGRIILVGVTGLNLRRSDFYEKELTFQVSCSYGPGRYDAVYEEKGQDYPLAFVRWTERRNFEAVLDLMVTGKLNVHPLVSKRVELDCAAQAYQELLADRSLLGILLTYRSQTIDVKQDRLVIPALANTNKRKSETQVQAPAPVRVGVIGAGNFAAGVLLPALRKTPAGLVGIASAGGVSAATVARKFGIRMATSDYRLLLDDPEINTVVIATRHDTHARLVIEALAAGKHVFVEKPLAMTRQDLEAIENALSTTHDQQLLVGYNRRFAPLVVQMRRLIAARSLPVSMIYTVNAGQIDDSHWTQDPTIGGGRIIGEACHFIDLLCYLAGSPLTGVKAQTMGRTNTASRCDDKMTILLRFADGSTGAVHYLANGNKSFPKERVEIFSEGRILVLDNFLRLRSYGWPGVHHEFTLRQDKGHHAELNAFVSRVNAGGPWLIEWNDLKQVSLATFAAVEDALRETAPLA